MEHGTRDLPFCPLSLSPFISCVINVMQEESSTGQVINWHLVKNLVFVYIIITKSSSWCPSQMYNIWVRAIGRRSASKIKVGKQISCETERSETFLSFLDNSQKWTSQHETRAAPTLTGGHSISRLDAYKHQFCKWLFRPQRYDYESCACMKVSYCHATAGRSKRHGSS